MEIMEIRYILMISWSIVIISKLGTPARDRQSQKHMKIVLRVFWLIALLF